MYTMPLEITPTPTPPPPPQSTTPLYLGPSIQVYDASNVYMGGSFIHDVASARYMYDAVNKLDLDQAIEDVMEHCDDSISDSNDRIQELEAQVQKLYEQLYRLNRSQYLNVNS